MAKYASTLEEEMAARGLVGSYVWKPNRLSARKEGQYISADVISDGGAYDVAETVAERGQTRLSEIEALAAAQKSLIFANERDYKAVIASLLHTYERMYSYFSTQKLYDLRDVMRQAIEQLGGEVPDA